MPIPVALSLEIGGQRIQGGSTFRGREGTINVLDFQMGVETPREPGSGMAAGRLIYQPITILKEIDRSTPLLYRALTQNLVVDRGIFKWYRVDSTGREAHYFTIALEQGRVVQVKTVLPNIQEAANRDRTAYDQVQFRFQTIRWTFEEGGIEHEDKTLAFK